MGKKRVLKEWKRKFRKFKLQINPIFQFYNSITGEENQNHRYTKAEVILISDNFKEYIDNLKSEFSSIIDKMEQNDSQLIFMKILSSDIFLYDVTDKRANSYIKSSFISKSIVMFKIRMFSICDLSLLSL